MMLMQSCYCADIINHLMTSHGNTMHCQGQIQGGGGVQGVWTPRFLRGFCLFAIQIALE